MRDLDKCLTALVQVLGNPEKDIGLHEPEFSGNESEYLQSCLKSGMVSSIGEYVTLFEKKLVEFTNIPYAIAVVNGTAALHLSLLLAGVEENDEVLIPALTFVATANAVAYCKAVPHFVDSSLNHLGIDVEKLKQYLQENTYIKEGNCYNNKTRCRIKGIVPVHIFGHPGDLDSLNLLAKEFYLTVIEDATESLGSYYQGKHTGQFGLLSVLSFNGNKIITTGGGGAILTTDPEIAQKAKHLSTTAKKAHRFEFYHDMLGFNYRLPNLNAALGCAQLEQLPKKVELKRKLAKRYIETFAEVKGVRILTEPSDSQSNYWLNALILEEPNPQFIEDFIQMAYLNKFHLRKLWAPLNQLPMYHSCPSMELSQTQSLYNSVIALPSSPQLEAQYA